MKYLKIILIAILFSFAVNNLNINNARADVPPPPPPIWYMPYSDHLEIEPCLYFPDGQRLYFMGRYTAANPKTKACGVEIFVPGPCDYSYTLYDEKGNVILKEKGSSNKYGNTGIKAKKSFKLPELRIDQTVTYKIKANVTLYNYKKDNDQNLDTEIDKKDRPRGMRPPRYGNPNDKYILMNKNGKKLEKESSVTIIRNANGEYVDLNSRGAHVKPRSLPPIKHK